MADTTNIEKLCGLQPWLAEHTQNGRTYTEQHMVFQLWLTEHIQKNMWFFNYGWHKIYSNTYGFSTMVGRKYVKKNIWFV